MILYRNSTKAECCLSNRDCDSLHFSYPLAVVACCECEYPSSCAILESLKVLLACEHEVEIMFTIFLEQFRNNEKPKRMGKVECIILFQFRLLFFFSPVFDYIKQECCHMATTRGKNKINSNSSNFLHRKAILQQIFAKHIYSPSASHF